MGVNDIFISTLFWNQILFIRILPILRKTYFHLKQKTLNPASVLNSALIKG
jgi:hypothetical protein